MIQNQLIIINSVSLDLYYTTFVYVQFAFSALRIILGTVSQDENIILGGLCE